MGHEVHWSEDGELYIRKSMIESFLMCPRKFYLEWLKGIQRLANMMMLQGTRFHEFAQRFFEFADSIDMNDWECMIPDEFNDHERRMALWFINYERGRLHDLILAGREDEWMPLLREHRMVDDEWYLESTLDRVDWHDRKNGELIIVEYKTGNKINEASVKRQIAFYTVLWYKTGSVGKVVGMRVINHNIGEVREFEVEEKDLRKVMKDVMKIRDAMLLKEFPAKCSEAKMAMCRLCSMEESGLYEKDITIGRFADMIVDSMRFVDVYGDGECE